MSQDQLRTILARLGDKLRETVTVRRGVVESVNPLVVVLDAERGTIQSPATVATVAPGMPVWVLRLGAFSLVLGAAGGVETSGSWSNLELPSWGMTGDPYGLTLQLVPPFTPPEGYWFETFALTTTGYTICQTTNTPAPGAPPPERVNVRVIQHGSNSLTALTRIGWRLTRIT